jgi:hypothetical protein
MMPYQYPSRAEICESIKPLSRDATATNREVQGLLPIADAISEKC